LLSALYLHRRYGWPVVAAYCQYTRLWHLGERAEFLRLMDSGRLCAVDLDLYSPTLPNIGHHILRLGDDDGELPGLTHSLNPNTLRGLSVQRGFRSKYPLATIHLLLWLFEEKPLSPAAEHLVWLADSTYINAQHYTQNVTDWVQHFLRRSDFEQILPQLQTLEFEENMRAGLLTRLSANPLCRPSPSKYRSRHLGLKGYQCQWQHPLHDGPALLHLLRVLSDITGWPLPAMPLLDPKAGIGLIEGRRQEIQVSELVASGLPFGEWLEREQVFSYAFTYRDRLNCTRI
ncbi:MAG TPA: hypothetical protein PK971_13190, partial [Saprospiraceae bacterium]|nr:hypothetical protein [Saprospiraceae bacterium]